MTSQYIHTLIERLNAASSDELIYLRELPNNVDYGKVWLQKPSPDSSVRQENPYNFYFIKNIKGIYVAAVLDMGVDLHWYVDERYRKKGILTQALKNVVLTHLFQDRNEQRITINKREIGDDNFEASEKVALALGFRKLADGEYVLLGGTYNADHHIDGNNVVMTESKMDDLKNGIYCLAQTLAMIQSEIEMKFGLADFAEELADTVKRLRSNAIELKEIYYVQQEK